MGRHFLSAALFALLTGASPLSYDDGNTDISVPNTSGNNAITTDDGDHGEPDGEGGNSFRRPGKFGKHGHGLGKGFGKGAGAGNGRGERFGKGLGHAGKSTGYGGLLSLLGGAGAGAGAGTGGLLGLYR